MLNSAKKLSFGTVTQGAPGWSVCEQQGICLSKFAKVIRDENTDRVPLHYFRDLDLMEDYVPLCTLEYSAIEEVEGFLVLSFKVAKEACIKNIYRTRWMCDILFVAIVVTHVATSVTESINELVEQSFNNSSF